MKKIAFTIYMTLLFSLMAIAQPAAKANQEMTRAQVRAQVMVNSAQPGISVREAQKLRHQQRQVNRIERRSKADGVITPREQRTIRRANRNLNRNIRQEKRDGNRH